MRVGLGLRLGLWRLDGADRDGLDAAVFGFWQEFLELFLQLFLLPLVVLLIQLQPLQLPLLLEERIGESFVPFLQLRFFKLEEARGPRAVVPFP